MRGLQLHRRDDDDVRGRALLDVGDFPALLVQEVRGDVERHPGADDGTALLQRLLLQDAQDRQAQGFDVADAALAVASRADLRGQLVERGTQPLAGHLQEAESRDAPDLHAGAILLQRLAHPSLHGALVLRRHHVDEVDHQQAARVAQP